MNELGMSEEARKARNRYNREWSAANKEKRSAINKRYWEKRAARLAAGKEVGNVAENADN